jgi:type IV secretion system protein VirB10
MSKKNQDKPAVTRDWRAQTASASKVNKTRSFNVLHSKPIMMMGAVVLAIALFMIWSGKTTPVTQKPRARMVQLDQNYESELTANLNKIQKMNQQSPRSATIFQTSNGKIGLSKAYAMRQNAPSTLYSANFAPAQIHAHIGTKGNPTFTGKDGYSAFGNQASVATSVSAQRVAHPKWTIVSGEFIHAVLETAIDSDLPGQLRAVISQPVYAYLGEKPLIPAGSRLIGQYSSSTLQGQNRVFVIWNRIILPDAVTVQLNSPGVDSMGRSGMGADSVNTHFFSRFGEAGLLSILGAGVSNIGVGSNAQYNSASQYRMNIAQALQKSANSSLKSSISRKPTLKINEGAALNVFVAHDLDFYSVRSSFRAGDE